MEEKRLLFLYNPGSGKGKIKNKLSDILDLFVSAGYTVTVRPTQARGDATAYIEKHGTEYDRVVCSGGDGTLDEVVKGMYRANAFFPIGYIPMGSTNDFAGSMGIPVNAMKAARHAVYGSVVKCDMGTFNDSPFVYVAAFGLWTEVSYATDQRYKNRLGHMAYVLEGIKSIGIGNVRPYNFRVVTEKTIIKDDFIYGMVTNSRSIGGYKPIPSGDVALDDGEFEVFLVKYPRSGTDLNQIITSLLSQEMDPEYIYYFKTSALEFFSEEEVSWTLDGEFGGSLREVSIRNHRQALGLYVENKK